jgi:hypothetical protein
MRRRRGDQRSEVGGQKSEYGAELTVSLSVIRYSLYWSSVPVSRREGFYDFYDFYGFYDLNELANSLVN